MKPFFGRSHDVTTNSCGYNFVAFANFTSSLQPEFIVLNFRRWSWTYFPVNTLAVTEYGYVHTR